METYLCANAHAFNNPNPINLSMPGNISIGDAQSNVEDGHIPRRTFEYSYHGPANQPEGLGPKWAALGNPDFSSNAKTMKKPVNLFVLITLTFFCVSGGPYGIEDAVSSAGPLLTLLGLFFLPIVWYNTVRMLLQ